MERIPLKRALGLLVSLSLSAAAAGLADEASTVPSKTDIDKPHWTLESATGGGRQFWTDELVFHDWRIQRNSLTGHYRLLDEKNIRRAWGTFEQCQTELAVARRSGILPPLGNRVVLVLHGLVRSRESMDELTQFLRRRGEFTVLNVTYASTRGKVSDHATALAKIVQHLDGVQEVSFVGHSLGNIVVRHYLHDREQGIHADGPVPRLGRIVMLGPPNQGADMARRFQGNLVFKAVWGQSGLELARPWHELEQHLAVPNCEFGIIAGGQGKDSGGNPFVPGDDDYVVSVAETRLGGAADFLVLPVSHSFMMGDDQVKECTLKFLQSGYFVAPNARQPIPIQ